MAKNDRGITLITLIVLIVVLIIISSMTLANITGDESIIGHAQNAKDATELNDQREQTVIKNILDIGNDESGSDSQIPQTGTKLVDVASIGDYVNYDPTTGGNVNATNTTYTSVAGSTTEHGNGYGSQTFSASNYKNAGKKWRILNIEGDKITLISELIYPDSETTKGLYLKDGIGYIWGEEELHRIASIYGHGYGADTKQTVTCYYGGPNDQDGSISEIDGNGDGVADNIVELQQGMKKTLNLNSGARALTVEDVSEICGVEETYTVTYSTETIIKDTNNAKYYPTIYSTDTLTGQSAAINSPSGNYYNTFYSYQIQSSHANSTAQINQNEMILLENEYWLASRCVSYNSFGNYFGFRTVYKPLTKIESSGICYCNKGVWEPKQINRPFVAVVILKSGITTEDTEYNSTTGWNLAK